MSKKNETAPKKKRTGRTVALVLVSVLCVLLLCGAGVLFYLHSMLNQINRTPITGNASLTESEIYQEEEKHPNVSDSVEKIEESKENYEEVKNTEVFNEAGVENILLVGSDRRSTNENGRADSTMILSINHHTGKIHLVSLMRAMYVYIPRSYGDTWGMLNAAYSWGGPQMLIDTVEANFRIHIDHYIVVDFSSFQKAIDSVGGVEITLTDDEAAYLSLPAGTQTLDGKQALNYSRIRYIDNDFVRTSRQRTVIAALLTKARSQSLTGLINMANEILPLLSTDMSNSQVLGYVSQAGTLLGYPVSSMMLPVENQDGDHYIGMMYVYGSEVYQVDFANNIARLHSFLRS